MAPSAASQYDGEGLQDTDLNDFLRLMIAELQNQDPLDPMKNSEMLEQLSQMRSIGATDKLTTTLDAVLLGQNLTSASTLIGRQVHALTDEGADVQGIVDRVTFVTAQDGQSRKLRVHIGQESIALENVREILPVAAESQA
jgi:flagellar basal-body rod modification protein FlgD